MDATTLIVSYGFVCLLIGVACGAGAYAALHRCTPVGSHTEPLIRAVREAEEIILERL